MTYILEEKLWIDSWLAYRLIIWKSFSPSYNPKVVLHLSFLLSAMNLKKENIYCILCKFYIQIAS